MTQNPPVPDYRRDEDHLNLLSIFHFIGAGLAVLGLFFLLAHFILFRAIIGNARMWPHGNGAPPPAVFFAFLGIFYFIGAVWFVVSGVLNLLSGMYLRGRKHRTFSIVVAAINCMHIPLGTVLGVFTLIVLARDSVRELYATGGN